MKRAGASPELEGDIAAALADGDRARAATMALRGYGPQILLYLRSVFHDDALTDDAFSQFCEKLWRSIGDFRAESSFATWAYRLAWYTTKEVKRGLARRRERPIPGDRLPEIAEEVRQTTAAYLRTEVKDRWAELRDRLDHEERSLLLLRVERRLPWKEIAAVMTDDGSPAAETALRKRFERLRAKLRRLFEEQGLRS